MVNWVRYTVLSTLLLAIFSLFPGLYADDDHSRHTRKNKTISEAPLHSEKDKGNEATGEAAALLFAIANITIAISLASKTAVKLSVLSTHTKERIKLINQTQKRFGMPVHYLINPLALVLASIHFFLPYCRSTLLPEWGLFMVASLVVIGILIKFRIAPKVIRKWTYLVHTSPLALASLLLMLIVGHSIMD